MQGRRHPTPGVVLATGIYRSGGPAPDPHTALTSGAAATLKLAAVPATFPSHQGLIIAAKLRWPDRFDATALCLGAAAPDLAYPLTSWLQRESHTPIGVVTWAVPVAAMTAVVLRRWAAPGLFACLPQLGRLQLRAYGALSTRRPSWWQTIASAGLGAVSHVFIDAFTHRGRWGANLLGLNGTVLKVPGLGELSGARVLQYAGHSLGVIFFLVALTVIASSGHVERWYGDQAVAIARARQVPTLLRCVFALVTFAPVLGLLAVTGRTDFGAIFLIQTTVLPSVLLAGAIVTRQLPRQATRPLESSASRNVPAGHEPSGSRAPMTRPSDRPSQGTGSS